MKKILRIFLCFILFCPISSIYAKDDFGEVNLTENSDNYGNDKFLEPKISYETHIQDIGWQSSKTDGQTAGTSGQSKRLEGIKINLMDNDLHSGDIQYQTHIQDIGWQDWKSNGDLSGTTNQSKRLEAIRIKLTGNIAEYYDIYYRVHTQNFGWLDWAKNGNSAGTAGYSYRLEAIEIKLITKDGAAPGNTVKPYIQRYIKYNTHVQDIGWQDSMYDGETAGTSGQSKRLEAIQINLDNQIYNGNIEYSTHIQDIGWQDWKSNGAIAGTSGQSKRLEAIKINLTNEMAENYDIYYRSHVSNFGWLGWAKNGEISGSTGWHYAIEAIEIKLVNKGGKAPGSTNNHYVPGLFDLSINQIDETTNVSIKLKSLKDLKQQINTVEIIAMMRYGNKDTREIRKEVSIDSFTEDGYEVNLGNYGKFSLEFRFKKDGQIIDTKYENIGVGASEYNLAPLSATFPVVYFSLSLWDITTSAETGRAIPTIVMLDRPSAYNWNNLPENVYGMPYLTKDEISRTSDFTAYKEYVKDLYEISPNAKFNLYLNDITCSYIQEVIYANKIPQGQYSIVMLSDGSATYSFINDAYNVSNPNKKHDELVKTWNDGKKYAYENGKVASGWGWHSHWDCMYALLTCEPGTQWWVSRNNLFTSGDGNVFAEKIKNDVTVKNVNTLLQNISAKGDETLQAFKNLYNFNDGYFSDAEKLGKKAMVLLGTYVNLESSFSDYARLTQLYYGDDYLYYYKGHPNTPTGLYPMKQAELKELGIADVDSAVAAELILFFNPELSLSGYGSSTFNSASSEMACGLYNTTKTEALTNSTIDYKGIDWFASRVTNTTEEKVKQLCADINTSYLLEFSDDILKTDEFDIGIYDSTKDTLKYYKRLDNGEYSLIKIKSEGTNINYSSHVSNLGWLSKVKEGSISGIENSDNVMEAFKAELANTEYTGSIEYQAHVSFDGWQSWVADGETAGTVGQSKAMEAIRIKLKGEIADRYDLYYRVYVKDYGWLDWAMNGEVAGTVNKSMSVAAIQIKFVKKGEEAPGPTAKPSILELLAYRTHVQNIGWQGYVNDGITSGTVNQSKRLEAIQIELKNQLYEGNVEYSTHIQDIGWQDWKSNGAIAGTSGQSKRLEAIKINLTGEMAEKYDIYYRVHAQNFGWLDWAKNGAASGTEGYSYRLEAIEIKLVKKGEGAPGPTENMFYKYNSWVANLKAARTSSQLIIVSASNGSYADVSMHTKDNEGIWQDNFNVSGRIGKNGINKISEGDGKTPTGIYSFGQAFGLADDPGSSKDYLKVNDNHYWVDDVNSKYYNKLVDIRETGIQWSSAEHLIEYAKAYKYALALDFNKACIPGMGSAIFLHCNTSNATAGCISIPEDNMVYILKNLKSDAKIIIDYSGNISNY